MMEDLEYDPPSKAFHDVRFVLLGFDAINKSKVLSKLVDGGGVDVGQYGPICTHVIVDKLIYDDPICIAARSDGKTLVNDLWVAHSFDAGMPVDPTNVMYRPLRDLKGIPGANSLVVCLTGYQRQDRDDIMTMVSQIGATFSKPLVANKVTHLICYKFEGEKYELAKKIKKIKLVNHMWLEDCLKAWEILPEADYDKSGYELEVLEAEAKDSEEETNATPKQQLLNPKQEFKGNQLDSSASRGPSNVVNTNDIMVSATGKEKISDQDPNLPEIHIKHPEVLDRLVGDVCSSEPVKSREKTAVAAPVGNELASTSGTEKSPVSNNASKSTPKSYSRKTQRKTPPSMDSGEMAGNLKTTPTVKGKFNLSDGSLRDGSDNGGFKTPEGTVLHPEGQSSKLDEITKIDVPYCSTKSQKADHDSKTRSSAGSPEMNKSQLLEPNNDNHNSSPMAALSLPQRSPAKISKSKSSSVGRKSPKCDTPVSETVDSKIGQDGNLVVGPHSLSVGSKMASLASKLVSRDVISREEHATGESPKVSSPKSKRLEIENASGSKPPTRKKLGRKSGSKGGNDTTNLKGSIYLNKSVAEDDPAVSPIGVEETAGINKNEVVLPAVDLYTDLGEATNYVSNSRNKVDQKSMSIDDETEPPEDKEENEVVEAVSEQKYGVFDPVNRGEDDKSEDLLRNKTELGGTKQKKAACGKRKLGESTDMQEVTKESNTNRGKKRTLSKIKKTTIPSEAQDFMAEVELPKAVSKENYADVEDEIVGNVAAEDKLEEMKTFDPEDKDGSKQKKGISGKRRLGESTLTENSVTENVSRGKKRPLFKSKKTTTPSEVPENKVPEAVAEDNYGEVRPNDMGNVGVEDKSEGKAGTKKKKGTSGNKRELGESTHLEDVVNENINAGKKHSVGNLKKSTGPSVTKINKLKEAANEEAESQKNDGGKTKKAETVCKLGKSVEMEKENMPLCDGDQNVSRGKNLVEKLAPKKASRKIDAGASKSNQDGVQKDLKSEPEPARFLLSAHKLQRREFQQIIKQLKGKACRDSHQWSYQATHLIVAEPVRRTEKFFAAAASGRWILKTDYLIDSNQAGKFLPEEAYEWKKSDTSEDGIINLEAPRKWRLQRERTGHGAFYGTRVVIYGECIAPSLETIKRVVKAGEGIILATSPPYTRFLKSGFDFALVSPGMLQDDMWIQEFLRHEIPCVAADYLVEFICKPGYPLDRHVQYDTHAWAEKSLNNLINRAVAIVRITTSPAPSNDDIMMTPPNDGDVACQVCASCDRGEEMLICGDESGAVGCGVGTHIDCCDPPLADVPEEDWFCPKCRESKSSGKKRTPKSAKKKTPVSRRN